jgi:hypothetical protein
VLFDAEGNVSRSCISKGDCDRSSEGSERRCGKPGSNSARHVLPDPGLASNYFANILKAMSSLKSGRGTLIRFPAREIVIDLTTLVPLDVS